MPNATETPYEHSQSDKKRKESQRFVKLKEVQACSQNDTIAPHLILPNVPKTYIHGNN